MSFEHINHHPMGPAQMDCTEYGDTWSIAMHKCNVMFKDLYEKVSAPIEHIFTATDAAAHEKIAELEHAVANLQMRIDVMARSTAIEPETPAVASTDPAAPAA